MFMALHLLYHCESKKKKNYLKNKKSIETKNQLVNIYILIIIISYVFYIKKIKFFKMIWVNKVKDLSTTYKGFRKKKSI